MVRQELEPVHVRVVLELVDLDARIVVDVDVLLLRRGEEARVVQPLDVAHRLAHLNLAAQLARLPVERGQMALASSDDQMPAVARIVASVRPQSHTLLAAIQLELETLLGRVDADVVLDLRLRHLERALQLALGLDHAGTLAGRGGVEILVGQTRRLGGALLREVLVRELALELLVLDARHGLGQLTSAIAAGAERSSARGSEVAAEMECACLSSASWLWYDFFWPFFFDALAVRDGLDGPASMMMVVCAKHGSDVCSDAVCVRRCAAASAGCGRG